MDKRKQIVRDGYEKIAGRYLEWSVDSKIRARYLEKLLALLPPSGAQVLELGCGAGLPVTKALTEYATVTAIDISPAQAARAAQNAPSASILCADMMAVEFPDAAFDAVAAFYAITHLPREEHGELFRRIARWLRPGGHFLASLGAAPLDDHVETDWHGAPNFFSHHDPGESAKLIVDAGLEILERAIENQDLEGEKGIQFLWLTACKPSGSTPKG
jgi:SAM-dependent methyltransferase